jgi:hypothetical protein
MEEAEEVTRNTCIYLGGKGFSITSVQLRLLGSMNSGNKDGQA